MVMTGVNVNAGGELGPIAALSSEQFNIPPANASIGGTSYGSIVGPMPPFRGVVVAGVIGIGIAVANEHAWPMVEISVNPEAYIVHGGQMTGDDLRQAYEELRRQMVSEGIPLLNAAELEREIADRKGPRS